MSRTIIFCFGGRQPNLELQLPFIHRILEENEDVEYHLWNLARTRADYRYIQSLPTTDRFRVINNGYSSNPWTQFNKVYQHYAANGYSGFRFVKLDDDVVFLESKRFAAYLTAIDMVRSSIVSARVINNGACTKAIPELFDAYQLTVGRHSNLLDVHLRPDYADLCHRWFFDHWEEIVDEPCNMRATEDWLSINCIGYNHTAAKRIASLINTPSPRVIAGRTFNRNAKLGDEGLVNTLPRVIFEGFTAAHLYFGPQLARGGERVFAEYRERYAEIGEKYLA